MSTQETVATAEVPVEIGMPKEIERFNVVFRIQHVILFTSFLLLSFSGWALKYPEVTHSSSLVRTLWGSPEIAGIVHRAAGLTMLLDFAWHVVYLLYLMGTGRIKWSMKTTIIPIPKDVIDVIHNYLYFFGLTKTRPKFGRFSYIHKFDYWAVFWGMGIIGSSGFILGFPVFASSFFPDFTLQWIWPFMRVLHSDEALLAIVFILFWHFYNEHLRVGKFPMSWTWITGKIAVEELKHEHKLEYDMLFPEAKKDEK